MPNVADRVAQTAAAMLLEEKLEPILCPDSYGYRPGRSAHDALAVARKRCWDKDWVLLYIERWLKAPMTMRDGTHAPRERGTLQGSPISPLLANLFMHYAFDKWMDREHSRCPFERYADDVVIHCDTEQQAQQLWADVVERLGSLGLELHPDQTKIMYCKDTNRRDEAQHTSFDFLGYTFCGRLARGRRGFFVSFSPAVSPNATKAIGKQISHWHLNRRSATDLAGLARAINAQIRGWFNYYGAFYRLRVVCHRSAHRRTSPPMGDAEVQTIARPTHQSVEMARRWPSARATTLRSLAPRRFNPTPDCGSRMTGDCHVRF